MPGPKRAAWYQSVRAHSALIELMDLELRRECGYPLAWYDVLVELRKGPGGGLRMNELADKTLLSRSWITRRIDQLERAELVRRERADDDDRGVRAVMTEAGRDAFRTMERIHTRSIERHFAKFLNDATASTIAETYSKIADHADAEILAHGTRGNK